MVYDDDESMFSIVNVLNNVQTLLNIYSFKRSIPDTSSSTNASNKNSETPVWNEVVKLETGGEVGGKVKVWGDNEKENSSHIQLNILKIFRKEINVSLKAVKSHVKEFKDWSNKPT